MIIQIFNKLEKNLHALLLLFTYRCFRSKPIKVGIVMEIHFIQAALIYSPRVGIHMFKVPDARGAMTGGILFRVFVGTWTRTHSSPNVKHNNIIDDGCYAT